MIGPPVETEYAPFYAAYIRHVLDSQDVVATLEGQRRELAGLPAAVGKERETHRYAEGKWSVREVLGHLGDAERVFGYRAFCISRGEQQSLPSFDEDRYAANSGSHRRPLADLVAELLHVRDANLSTFRSLDGDAWTRTGVANGKVISVRALAYVIAGHCQHHLVILRERYGVG